MISSNQGKISAIALELKSGWVMVVVVFVNYFQRSKIKYQRIEIKLDQKLDNQFNPFNANVNRPFNHGLLLGI